MHAKTSGDKSLGAAAGLDAGTFQEGASHGRKKTSQETQRTVLLSLHHSRLELIVLFYVV